MVLKTAKLDKLCKLNAINKEGFQSGKYVMIKYYAVFNDS